MNAHTGSTGSSLHSAHGHDNHDDEPHGSLRQYTIGFILSVILTIIPFVVVMGELLANRMTASLVIMGLGAIQVVVHMVYFLHLNARSEDGWNMLALIFTLVMVVILLAGSVWVMFHLNANMMPVMKHDMTNVH